MRIDVGTNDLVIIRNTLGSVGLVEILINRSAAFPLNPTCLVFQQATGGFILAICNYSGVDTRFP